MSNEEPVDIDYDKIVVDTGQALLLKMDDEELWLPKSLIEDHDEEGKSMTVPYWWAYKNDLI